MDIELSQFLAIFYKYHPEHLHRYQYVDYLLYLFMREDAEAEPFSGYESTNSMNQIFSGHDKLSAEKAAMILNEWDASQFIRMFKDLSSVTQENIKVEFEALGVHFYSCQIAKQLADIMYSILSALAGKERKTISRVIDNHGKPIREATLSEVYYDHKRRKIIFINDEEIDVPKFEFPTEITPEEMALSYFVCLLEAYADSKHLETISLEQVKRDPYLLEDLNDQREYFYKAQYFRRIVQTVVDNPEEKFEELEEEIYEGIKEIYRDRFHHDGLDRLQKVETAVMNANLSSADLSRFTKLFKSSEKKGMCHVLVEDRFISTWVLDNE